MTGPFTGGTHRWTDDSGQEHEVPFLRDASGQEWELVRAPAAVQISDAQIGFILGMLLLISGFLVLGASLIWHWPDWLAGPLVTVGVGGGLLCLMVASLGETPRESGVRLYTHPDVLAELQDTTDSEER
jgi:hypothetical protein